MTVQDILKALRPYKRVSKPQVYRYFRALDIEPLGARQRPQQYSEDTPLRIRIHLGDPKLVSLSTLKAEKRKARRNGRNALRSVKLGRRAR
jgi:hypothetical protein